MLSQTDICVFMVLICISLSKVSSQDYRYGTKTPYKPGNLESIQSPQGCKPVHLNMVVRHGSRFPSNGNKETIMALLKKLNQAHSSGFKYKNITLPWQPSSVYKIAEGSELSPKGEQELYYLGKRFRARFPNIFRNTYWNRFYEFISTDKLRTARSAAAFSYGVFEGKGMLGNASYQPIPIKFSGPKDNDKLLRYYDACPKYKAEIVDGSGMDEWKKFGKGPEIKQLIATIEERLKIKGKVSLTAEDVQDLFMLCAFATLNDGTREWCSLFTNSDIDVLNYWIDLEEYYVNSYGNQISYKTSCPLVADITKTLRKFVNASVPFGIFRFGHSGTILGLESLLELNKESVTLRSGEYRQNINRKFRIYNIIPMAANVAFVLYKCDKEYKVQLLVNEKLMSLPCCVRNGQTTCSLDTFMSCYEHIGKNCDFDAMCKVSSSAGLLCKTSWWFIMMIIIIINLL